MGVSIDSDDPAETRPEAADVEVEVMLQLEAIRASDPVAFAELKRQIAGAHARSVLAPPRQRKSA